MPDTRIAIVTGAGSGIGRAIALELAKAGDAVMLAGRRKPPLDELQAEISRSGGKARVQPTDVTDDQSLKALVAATVEGVGRLDILINNAGVGSITDLDDPAAKAGWDAAINTNLTAVFALSHQALPHMKQGGRIVNIASVLAQRAVPRAAAYCASKHGLIGLTRAMALDVASRGITVNAVCPGWVDTEMAQKIFRDIAQGNQITPAQARERAIEGIPLKRMVEATEVARLVLYLCSPDAAAITGQSITICGGSSLV